MRVWHLMTVYGLGGRVFDQFAFENSRAAGSD